MTSPAAEAHETASETEPRQLGLLAFSLIALALGALTGLGAAGLRALIALFHNLFFLGEWSFRYDATAFEPFNPWGPAIVLAPVIGGLGVVWLVRHLAPEARGPGVAEVMDAVYYRRGRMRPRVVLVKSVASALSIGSGASVGREGPIVQIGSGIGSSMGQFLRLSTWQTITLVAAGAGAGIAATFNTPLGAVMFAVEMLLPEVSPRTFLPVLIATGAATLVGWLFFGASPAFLVPLASIAELGPVDTAQLLPLYLLLGLLCGLAATAFVRLLDRMEDLFPRISSNAYVQNVAGMLVLGVMIYAAYAFTGRYHVAGVGYATIQGVFAGDVAGIALLASLFAMKLLATTVSLGAGASGGVFSPSLFLGVTLGGAFGSLVALVWPNLGATPVEFAVIGMAGVAGGATGAAMTAVLMVFEMTQDYHAIVPAILVVAGAIGLRRALSEENIYTVRLARRGRPIPQSQHSTVFLIRQARELQAPILGRLSLEQLESGEIPFAAPSDGYFLVTRSDRVVGVLPAGAGPRGLVRDFCIVRERDFLRDVNGRMLRRKAHVALVTHGTGVPRADDVTGVITRSRLGTLFLEQWAN